MLDGLFSSQFIVSATLLPVMLSIILGIVAYSIYLERKISAYIQDRLGPNRVGFDFGQKWLWFLKGKLGLGQPMADGIKFLLKEDYRPARVDAVLFTLAPMMSIIPAMIGFAIIPWGGLWDMPVFDLPLIGKIGGEMVHVTGAHVSVGVIFITSVASLGVYGITIGGWASNNKFSFLGGLRATASMISYEIPMGLSLLAAIMVVGSFMPHEIIAHQRAEGWLLFAQPIAGVLFFICILAEANRAPFDNAEAEQELVGGYHTEYSSMRFAMFFLAEYSHMVTSCAFFTLLFLGGWQPIPFVEIFPAEATGLLVVFAKISVFLTKVVGLICFMMLVRWTLPRLRYDQVMMLNWQSLIPISLVVIVVTSVLVYLGQTSLIALLVANAVVFAGVLAGQGMFTRSTINKRVPQYGSRFCPVPGSEVLSYPTDPAALEDRPAQGTAPVAG